MDDANYSQALSMILNKFPITNESLEMEKLLQYGALGKKLPRLKLHRKVKSPIRSSRKVKIQESSIIDDSKTDSEIVVVSSINNKNHEDGRTTKETISIAELKNVEIAKEKAIVEASRLQVAAQLAYAEVERLSKEIKELEGSRLQAVARITHDEVDRLAEEIKVLEKVQVQNLIAISKPSLDIKRWNSENLNVRVNNKKLNPEDYIMDVEDKGDEIEIKLRILQ